MEQRLKFHLELAKGRKIVVWGTGGCSVQAVKALRQFGVEIACFVSKDYEKMDTYDGILVGKCSYFPSHFSEFIGENAPLKSIASIGRFTSINKTAQVHVDHSLSALSTGLFHPIIDNEY